MTSKMPILVEIIGESAVGKTHTSCLFPKSVLFDMTPEKEGELIAIKIFGNDYHDRYFKINNYNDFLNAVTNIPDDTKTVVIDTSKDFIKIIADEWLVRENRKLVAMGKRKLTRVYPTTLYGQVYRMADDEVKRLMKIPCNVVFTSIMTDEYVNSEKTGRRVRDGYSRLPFQCWLRIAISIENGKRIYKIIKNRFVDKISDDYVESFNNEDIDNGVFDKILDITFRKAGLEDTVVM